MLRSTVVGFLVAGSLASQALGQPVSPRPAGTQRPTGLAPCSSGRPATRSERAAATRVVAASVHTAAAYLLKPRLPRNAKAFEKAVPRPEPFNTYRRHASSSRLPLKNVHLDAFWRFGGCIDTRRDRDPANDVVEIGAGADWTVDGDTRRLRPWPYLGTTFQFSVVGIYRIARHRIVAFRPSG